MPLAWDGVSERRNGVAMEDTVVMAVMEDMADTEATEDMVVMVVMGDMEGTLKNKHTIGV